MRREPQQVGNRWLDREKRRGGVRRRPCYQCGRKVWIPQHLFGVQRLCETCETPEESRRVTEAAAEWRRFHTLSPKIEQQLDA